MDFWVILDTQSELVYRKKRKKPKKFSGFYNFYSNFYFVGEYGNADL